MLGVVEQGGDLAEARPELIGDMAPCFAGGLAVGLN